MSNSGYSATSVGLTLYKEVKRQVLEALAAKEWEPGDVIPPEKQLCIRFGVSVGTLRKAIDELVAENILIRHQGRGTFVALHNRGSHLYRFFNVVRHDSKKFYPTLALKLFEKKKADKTCSEKLGIERNSVIFRFTNLRSLDEKPVLVDRISLPESLFAGLTEAQVRDRPSTLYNLYQSEYGLNIIRIEERVRASLADAELSKLLDVDVGAPLLQIHRVAFSYNDQPVEYRVSYVNTENYEYVPSAP
ncbi:MAG: GntR family transcriptional regulator [Herminiimonas sp.]|uniref:GntR family transcriptional regulator n=1 Tax=Herminiimonas sp. TaxID=1926289 RepID=UPI00271D28F4|nr:GntR family transcriptional regulator [Herminiimonas sp.]MDO9420609.1 GntR family transcriptional regulator [Herminiimonas sp.]